MHMAQELHSMLLQTPHYLLTCTTLKKVIEKDGTSRKDKKFEKYNGPNYMDSQGSPPKTICKQ